MLQDGKNSLLVDFFSPKQIAESVDEVFAHVDRMQAIREAARQTIIERYEVRQSLKQYQGVISMMVKPTKENHDAKWQIGDRNFGYSAATR